MSTATATPTTSYVATLPKAASTYADFAASQPIVSISCVSNYSSPYYSYTQNFYDIYTITPGTAGQPRFYTEAGGTINLTVRKGYYADVTFNSTTSPTTYYYGVYTFINTTGVTGAFYIGVPQIAKDI